MVCTLHAKAVLALVLFASIFVASVTAVPPNNLQDVLNNGRTAILNTTNYAMQLNQTGSGPVLQLNPTGSSTAALEVLVGIIPSANPDGILVREVTENFGGVPFTYKDVLGREVFSVDSEGTLHLALTSNQNMLNLESFVPITQNLIEVLNNGILEFTLGPNGDVFARGGLAVLQDISAGNNIVSSCRNLTAVSSNTFAVCSASEFVHGVSINFNTTTYTIECCKL